MTATPAAGWRLQPHVRCQDVDASLSPHFGTEWLDASVSTATYYDIADGALWHDGYLLSAGADRGLVLSRAGDVVATGTLGGDAKFWWDFAEGPLRDALRHLTGVRALVPVATQEVAMRELLLYNADRKIVVRASLVSSSIDGLTVQYLSWKPLRGYDAEHLAACRRVGPLLDAKADLDSRSLLARHPIPAWVARPAVALPVTASMPAERAVRVMGHAMLEQARHHVAGIVDDVDTEYLHAFRVGLRKTRSLVSLLKKALPATALDKLKPRLAGMAGRTNRLRDLDVYLLAQHDYVAMLPADYAAGMADLTARVRTQRKAAHEDVASYLSSAAFQADVDACLAELSLQASFSAPAASKPVLAFVKRQMLKRYAAMEAMSGQLHEASQDDDIHALRIEFKKLRYLIEFFQDLLPRKRSHKLLGDLKKIQGILGAFNDLSVQIDFLNAFHDPARGELTKALNGLTAILHLKKVEVRHRIFDALDGYFTENRGIEFALVFSAAHRREAA